MTTLSGSDGELDANDRACANCAHVGHSHLVREVEVPGNTIRETFCSDCGVLCEFVPEPDGE